MSQLTIALILVLVLLFLFIRSRNLVHKINELDAALAKQKDDLEKAQDELANQSTELDKCRGSSEIEQSKNHENEVEITALKAIIGDRYDQLEKIQTTVDTYKRLVNDLKRAHVNSDKSSKIIEEQAWLVGELEQKLLESRSLISALSDGMSWQRWRIGRLQKTMYDAIGPRDPDAFTYVCGDKFSCHYMS